MHSLITGITGSGKSLLMKELILKDPFNSILFSPFDDFFLKSYSLDYIDIFGIENIEEDNIYIDEAGELLNRDRKYNHLATLGRHYGKNITFIAQRAKMLTPEIRTNCEKFYLFTGGGMDSKILSEETGKKINLTNLKRFEYYEFTNFSNVELKKLDMERLSRYGIWKN